MPGEEGWGEEEENNLFKVHFKAISNNHKIKPKLNFEMQLMILQSLFYFLFLDR